jgi:hypothetical protein
MPSHKCYTYHMGRQQTFETFPIGKHSQPEWCSYCLETHDEWWRMDDRDYGRQAHVILCGKCENTKTCDADPAVSWHGERMTA